MFGNRGRGFSTGFRGRSTNFRGASSVRGRFGDSQIQTPAPELGQLLTEIQRKDLDQAPKSYDTKLMDFEVAGSYNWMSPQSGPTIAIPGSPPKWTPPAKEARLQEDSGGFFRDFNAGRYPKHPMQPAVEAVLASDLNLSVNRIDLFTCSRSMENLLRFALGLEKSFRIVVEIIEDTIFFIRRENSPTELIPDIHGFAHTMARAYTSWDQDVKGSESHQRIVKYVFGELSCAVRFEPDGYLSEHAPNLNPPPKSRKSNVSVDATTDADSILSSAFQSSSLSIKSQQPSTDGPLIITEARNLQIPQKALYELRTRSIRKIGENIMGEYLLRLWINQISNWILAFHDRGLFRESRIEIVNIRTDVESWERKNQDALQRFAVLLHKIIERVKNHDGGRLEIHRSGEGPLQIRDVGGDFNRCLPDDVKKRWTQAVKGKKSTKD